MSLDECVRLQSSCVWCLVKRTTSLGICIDYAHVQILFRVSCLLWRPRSQRNRAQKRRDGNVNERGMKNRDRGEVAKEEVASRGARRTRNDKLCNAINVNS